MLKEALLHIADNPFAFAVGSNELKVRLRAKKEDVARCSLLHSDRYQSEGRESGMALSKVAWDELYDYFEGIIPSDTKRVRYVFLLEGTAGDHLWYGEKGIAVNREGAGYFQFAYITEQDLFTIPDWVHDGIVYQIFPERFYNGDPKNDPPGTLDWDEPLTDWKTYYGGDLAGIEQKLPYLEGLGINVIYMTPVFTSTTNHKYDTTDYYSIDPQFGDLDTVKSLVKEAHSRGIRIIFDAVFNHCGDTFFAFQDVLKNGESSKYADWFFIDSFPVVQRPKTNYETFANSVFSMPKLNTKNPEVREYLLQVARYWIEETGIDGWRLDVANEVDHEFWRAFRKVVKEANPEAVIIGEVWHDSRAWLRGDQFDGVMNYLFKEALNGFFAKQNIGVRTFNNLLTHSRMIYSDQANAAMFNLIDSHDTERFLTACTKGGWGWNEEKQAEGRMKLAAFFQLTYPGMPMIYYGDEVGMEGENDPYCRKPMVWEKELRNESMLDHYRSIISLRKEHPELARGSYETWLEDELKNTYGYIRTYKDQASGLLINNSPKTQVVKLSFPWKQEGDTVTDLITGKKYAVSPDTTVHIDAYGYMVFK
ncbi:glycoside hydrolase family 13 protein [Paenibacillus abyssi]|uniref:Neopullulanase n=1 Tax=Paenibacillus abyssi TaxID=1340531 RepID=A0A917CN06_9BACL|nr:glycoside hydrolase family 13 protein [Paenibacillus abyssi]GGF94177.1 neopullulanase [Paenibacillus abyssi]